MASGKLLKIGLDIDGVMARFEEAFAQVVLSFSKRVDYLPVGTPDFPAVWDWPSYYGVEKEAEQKAWEWVMDPANYFWDDLPPMEGDGMWALADRLNDLRLDGHDIYFITSRPGAQCKHKTEQWLRAWGISNPTVLISNKKGWVAAGLQLDAFIDDRDRNAMEVALVRGRACRVFLLERPYNAHCKQEWKGQKYLEDVEVVATVGEMLDRLGLVVEDGEEVRGVAA